MANYEGKSTTARGTYDAIRELAKHMLKENGEPNQSAIAREAGCSRDTVVRVLSGMYDKDERVEYPAFVTEGDEEEPISEVIDRLTRNFKRAKRAQEARKWFPIKIKENKPIGILFVGDPHVDDNGCNWPALRAHARICQENPGIYAVNIGDVSNDWGGRLIKKYADQETSIKTAHRLVEWFLLDSGFDWLIWLHGNHQHMGESIALHEQMNKRFGTTRVPMLDWEARFVIEFANGQKFRINAAHDFPGNSIYNPVHGAVKAAKFGDNVDVAVCGHKHNWAVSQWEQAEQGNMPLMIRVRGYKHLDEYARRIGKYEQEEGQSILVVFDPNAGSQAARTQAFVDIEMGAKYLSMLRQEHQQ